MKKGFTLIELLVVIAIIGILSGIVLTSLNSARTKAREARATAGLSQIRTVAEIIADGSSYSPLCDAATHTVETSADTSLPALVTDITENSLGNAAPTCYANDDNFCVSIPVTGGYKCASQTKMGAVVCKAADSCDP